MSDATPASATVGGILLWILVTAGLVYGIVQTASKVVQLFS